MAAVLVLFLAGEGLGDLVAKGLAQGGRGLSDALDFPLIRAAGQVIEVARTTVHRAGGPAVQKVSVGVDFGPKRLDFPGQFPRGLPPGGAGGLDGLEGVGIVLQRLAGGRGRWKTW